MIKTMAARATVAATSRGRGLNITVWVVQILLALLFALVAFPKLSGASTAVAMFTTIGIGQWFRYAVGVAELAGAIGLLIPRLAGLAALGLVADMIGAIAVQALIFRSGQLFPIIVLLLVALVAWARWPQTTALVGVLRRYMGAGIH